MNTTGGGDQAQAGGFMAQMMSGVLPVKQGVDQILAACKQIVQSGAVPGAEQVCAQIVSFATQLVPMALQQQMGQGMGQGSGGGPAMPAPMAPPNGPQPILGPGQGPAPGQGQ
jgi:hypothetical protein